MWENRPDYGKKRVVLHIVFRNSFAACEVAIPVSFRFGARFPFPLTSTGRGPNAVQRRAPHCTPLHPWKIRDCCQVMRGNFPGWDRVKNEKKDENELDEDEVAVCSLGCAPTEIAFLSPSSPPSLVCAWLACLQPLLVDLFKTSEGFVGHCDCCSTKPQQGVC